MITFIHRLPHDLINSYIPLCMVWNKFEWKTHDVHVHELIIIFLHQIQNQNSCDGLF
jgi:hypothetical protein